MSEVPFTLAVPDNQIQRLKAKLELTTLPDELDEAAWSYGVPLADIKRLIARWKDGYDWKTHEAAINQDLPQFTRDVEVDGFGTLNIHYVHKKSDVPSAIPLLFVHGWPGSFLEVRKVLPLLTAGGSSQPSFHVVAFSLPGYGFSEAPKKKGFRIGQFAEIGHKLMLALGYNEYVTQGGDWGTLITMRISSNYGGKNAKAWHCNTPMFPQPPHPLYQPISFLVSQLTPYTPAEKALMERGQWFQRMGSGYVAIQSTQPQTLGYSLADSPGGLLAWIYEKLVLWTDGYPWTDDEGKFTRLALSYGLSLTRFIAVLTWISIYWFSRAGPAASIRIYYETIQSGDFSMVNPPKVPTGYSYFPKELGGIPRSWLRGASNVVFESDHERGGHFPAHECPEALVDDLRKMFGKGGPAFGVVPRMNGYS
ncbi:hypothetical protein HGRIS_014212 [Hohenbuehelia grisea]|uniref:Epoxide hydrolase N-terminal domain-containing protein n=1 Tax=Hohenbuehelia grisea TaxID=104357 RepID=A0ABR3JST6_9AGAR